MPVIAFADQASSHEQPGPFVELLKGVEGVRNCHLHLPLSSLQCCPLLASLGVGLGRHVSEPATADVFLNHLAFQPVRTRVVSSALSTRPGHL